ncbi:MAG: InlB B-repeat-containing protein [Bacilli bacterium]|nr:InlB B-repeat-containing protein [Bacilli bacterium]
MYPTWYANDYVVTYDARGGIYPGESSSSKRTSDEFSIYTSSDTKIEPPFILFNEAYYDEFEKAYFYSYYALEGWYLDEEFENKVTYFSELPFENVTLYAKYESTLSVNRITYNVYNNYYKNL